MITTSSSFSRPSLPSSAASLAPAGPLSSRPPPPRRFSELPPVPPTPDRSTFSSNSSTLSLPLSARLLGGSAHMSDSPDPPRKRGPPGPSSAASLTKKGILKHNSSALSLANGSSSGSSSPGRARPVDAHSLAEGVGSTTDATFRTASEGHSTLAATCDDACWTPPIQHGMPAELQLPVPVAAVAPSRRPAPLPAFPPATLASLAPGSTQTFVTAPSTSSSLWPATPPSTASTPTGEPVAGQNTYFIPSPHRRMSERDLAALAARTTRPKDDAAAAAKPFSAGRFALPGFRRRRSEDGPSRDRSASVGGRPPVPLALDPRPLPPLARNDSAGSVGSSACCRGNGAIEGESLSDLVRPDERTTRRRSRTLGTYDVYQEQVFCDVLGAPPRAIPRLPASHRSRLARPETRLRLSPPSGGPSDPDDRTPSPNHAWRESLLTEAVSLSMLQVDAGSPSSHRTSHLPAPPPPPNLPSSPASTPRKGRTIKRRRATMTAATRPAADVDAERNPHTLPPTPDLFRELQTVRRQASRPLLSDALFSSWDSASLSLQDVDDDDQPSTPRPAALAWRPRGATVCAPGPDFPPDFEDPALYESSASGPSQSGSSTRTLADLAMDSPEGTSLTTASVRVREGGDDNEGLVEDGGADDDSLVERGTLGERKDRNRFGFSAIDEESLRTRSMTVSQRTLSIVSSTASKDKHRPEPLSLYISNDVRQALPVVASLEFVDEPPRSIRRSVAHDAPRPAPADQRSVSGLSSSETTRSTVSTEAHGWAQPPRGPALDARRGFYDVSKTTFASSTPNLPSQHTPFSSGQSLNLDALPPVPLFPARYDYQPTSPLLQDLDPRLPITNTLPRGPASPSAALRSFFSRRPTKYRAPSGLSSADGPPALGTALRRSRMAPVPVSAFAEPHAEGLSLAAGPGSPGPPPRERSIAEWAAATQTVKDPSVSRLEGLLHQHQELERERLRTIIHGQAGRARTISQS